MTKLEYHSLTALKAETQEYRRKSLFMLQMYKKSFIKVTITEARHSRNKNGELSKKNTKNDKPLN